MREIELEYGRRKIRINLPSRNLVGIFSPRERRKIEKPILRIKESLRKPLNTPPLKEIARKKKRVTIVIDDDTRPLPSKLILPPLLEELLGGGIKRENLKILISTGVHPPLTREKIRKLVGSLSEEIEVVNHDAYSSSLVPLRRLEGGLEPRINRWFLEADLKILLGDVEFHQIFGYGGGAKSILPGLSDEETIRVTHSWLDLKEAKAGSLESPARKRAEEVTELLGVDFSLQVVLNPQREVVGIFSGELKRAFLEGVKLTDKIYKIKVPERVDVVMVTCGGWPRDANLYQAQKGVENAIKMVKKGGKIILIAECGEGWGSETFQRWAYEISRVEEVRERIEKRFELGGHKLYQFLKEKEWAKLYLCSQLKDKHLKKFITPLEFESIPRLLGEKETVAILKNGSHTLPVVEGEFLLKSLRGGNNLGQVP